MIWFYISTDNKLHNNFIYFLCVRICMFKMLLNKTVKTQFYVLFHSYDTKNIKMLSFSVVFFIHVTSRHRLFAFLLFSITHLNVHKFEPCVCIHFCCSLSLFCCVCACVQKRTNNGIINTKFYHRLNKTVL